MSCTSPLKAFFTYQNNGKKKIDFYSPERYNFKSYESFPDDNKILIPCGQCISCRLKYSRDWATRCVLESLQYDHNYFVTLTYNPESLPVSESFYVDKDTGEFTDGIFSASLDKSVIQKFMKDLRRYYSYHFNIDNIRFFACGEYGSKNLRPHYHLILFNCPIPDLKFECSNFQGDSYYSSEIFNKLWHYQGFVTIGDCNYSTCSYVARYMLKKQKGLNSDKFYGLQGLVPPFTLCSRDPGIARSYYDKNSNRIYEYDSLIITGSDGVAKVVRPPSYFDKLYDIDCPEDLKKIKDKRKASAEASYLAVLDKTSLSSDDYLKTVDLNIQSKSSKLLRNL